MTTKGSNTKQITKTIERFSENRMLTGKYCSHCSAAPPIWKCEQFMKLSYEERKKVADRNNLCYRCLDDDHIRTHCPRSKLCGIGGCHETHSRLLHGKKKKTDARSRIRRLTDARRYRQPNPIQSRKLSRNWRTSLAVIGNRDLANSSGHAVERKS